MIKYKQLSLEERQHIFILLQEWKTKKEIAKQLSRNPSTVSREIKRNSSLISKNFNWINTKYKTSNLYHYLPDTAQNKYTNRRKIANYRTPLKNVELFHYVIEKLKQWWSPDIISWILKLEAIQKYKNLNNKLSKQYTISHETIYKFIYSKKWEELNLKQFLVRRHKRRRHYTWRKTQKLPKIPNPASILERKNYFPKLENRQEFGHFEWDSILSKRQTFSAIHTEVERKSRFIFATKIKKKTAINTEQATINIFSKFQNWIIKSITWDNWLEFANHKNVTDLTWIKIFFAEPYKSWQRWTNEHANWMIRRYFPKWTNFDEITEEELQEIVQKINNRPRKILWYKSSKEVWDEYLKSFN